MLKIQNNYQYPAEIELIDEVPVQFQDREFSIVRKLKKAGVRNPTELKAMKDEEIAEIKGLGEKAVEKIRRQLKQYRK